MCKSKVFAPFVSAQFCELHASFCSISFLHNTTQEHCTVRYKCTYTSSHTELQHYSAASQVRLQRNQCSEAKHFITVGRVVIFYFAVCLGCHLGQLLWLWLMWVNHGYWGRHRLMQKLMWSAWRREKKSVATSGNLILFCFEIDSQEVLVMIKIASWNCF